MLAAVPPQNEETPPANVFPTANDERPQNEETRPPADELPPVQNQAQQRQSQSELTRVPERPATTGHLPDYKDQARSATPPGRRS